MATPKAYQFDKTFMATLEKEVPNLEFKTTTDPTQAVQKATQAPTLRQRAAALDKRRSKPYWNTPLELSARSFELASWTKR